MPTKLDVGDNCVAAPDVVPIAPNGSTITITNVAGSDLLVLKAGINGAATTVTATNTTTVTLPAWMLCASGRATVTLSGGMYG